MKYLYFGTICNHDHYMEMMDSFRVKPSIAPFVFETALLKGMRENDADLEAISFPSIPAFPKSRYNAWRCQKETLDSGFSTTWLGALNISGIKQLCQRFFSYVLLKKWLKKNRTEEKAVIIYSAYQPVSKSVVTLCRKYGTKCYAIIPDLPRDMYNVARIGPVKKLLSKAYVCAAERVQGLFDGYIYLTEAMREVISPEKPYTVVEGIADGWRPEPLTWEDKAPGFVIMYAGSLHRKYGIENLVAAFRAYERKDAQLWIFGSGDYQQEIRACAEEDSRIRFFGRVSREQVLEYERRATVLINVRDGNDEFTKYSFPSKTIEYMLSGTPVLMTKLPGVPEPYFRHVYCLENNRPETLHLAMEELGSMSAEQMLLFGAKAQQFIMEEKNARAQAAKILQFIENNGRYGN